MGWFGGAGRSGGGVGGVSEKLESEGENVGGGDECSGLSLCHRCDGQLQRERAPMLGRWSVECC